MKRNKKKIVNMKNEKIISKIKILNINFRDSNLIFFQIRKEKTQKIESELISINSKKKEIGIFYINY